MSEEQTTAKTPTRKKTIWANSLVWIVVIILIVVLGAYGYNKWVAEKSHIYTDNAQIQGRIVKILSPESGYIKELLVTNNIHVKKDQHLAQLSDDNYRWEVDRAQAQYNVLLSQQGSEKDAGLSAAQLASAQANLEVIQSQLAEAQAKSDQSASSLSRKQMQLRNGDINQNQFDQAKATDNQAKASLLTLQKEAYAAQQSVIEAQANSKLIGFNLNSAKASLAEAQQRLNNTLITSPINGVIAKQTVEQGLLVQAGQYLMSVVSLSDVWIVANIKETDFLKVKPGASVNITVDSFPGRIFPGVVNSISPATGDMFSLIPKNNASGNFIKVPALIPVRIDFVGLPEADFHLLPGMSAEVQIAIDGKALSSSFQSSETEHEDKQQATEDDTSKDKSTNALKPSAETVKSDSKTTETTSTTETTKAKTDSGAK